MTELLERAFAEAAKLAPREQDIIATWMLSELKSEDRWSQLFAQSQAELAQLATDALSEHHGGRTDDLDSDEL